MSLTKKLLLAAAAVALCATAAHAQGRQIVSPDTAARLGKDLNPMGGIIAGEGEVAEWTPMSGVPSGISFNQSTQNPPNPFASDQPKFRITAANMGQYEDKLTEGYKALLRTYDTYFIDVYESRRTCGYPQEAYDKMLNNAKVGQLTEDGTGVLGAIGAHPFPGTTDPVGLLWNHTLGHRGGWKIQRQFAAAPVQPNGSYNLIVVQDDVVLRWQDPSKQRAEDLGNRSLYYISNTVAPPRLAGNVILVHESLNASIQPRDAWAYNPGTRRVRRAPDISFDNPGTNTDGMSTSDAFDGFNGSPERYDWTYAGKSVKYVAYNNFDALNSKYADLLKPRHLNQDLVRYEAHRVNTVEGKLKSGSRHVYSRRVKHLDEDTGRIVATELYDSSGNLWRVQEVQSVNRYHVPVCGPSAEVVYDLQSSRYLALSMSNEEAPVNYTADNLNEDRYTPQAIRELGKR